MGPHPAVAATRTALAAALADQPPAAPLVIACSGGADSTALLAAAAFLAERTVRTVRPVQAVTVDHGLQAGSAQRAQDVAALARSLGLAASVATVEVAAGPGSGGPEAAARAARYAALDAELDAAAAGHGAPALLALAHTRDDQAETVLLGLGRGAGPRSLAGMAPVSVRAHGVYLRPFLGLDRAMLRAACAALGLPVWDDPHNADPRYRRVRVRTEALPLLDDVLGGGVPAALARTAALLRDDLAALDALAAPLLEAARDGDGLAVAALAPAPRALRTRVLRAWLAERGAPALSGVHLDAADALVAAWRGQRGADLPGGFALVRASGRLVLHDPAHSRATTGERPAPHRAAPSEE